MLSSAGKTIKQRLHSLEQHLRKENPVLIGSVQSYRMLDQVGRSLGMIDSEQSFATQISWWPMISVLGTFSAGKSTFINHYLGTALQPTGNQAVDDKFTVICFGGDHPTQSLPGSALDADPRFPFYKISNELEKVAAGEGRRVDTYLQLKTCHSEQLRGRIIIDSPGFDADSQRTATLRLSDHIFDLSDLVLVFFDARHPEPGAMRDTLTHLVGNTVQRPDATKFIYILNQMDTAAHEDNPEAVVGAWQRALAQEGLTAGRFYCIYNPDVAVPIEDAAQRKRYEAKRDHDLDEIHERIQRVGVERAYRIIGTLEKLAHHIGGRVVPRLRSYLAHWRKLVLLLDGALLLVLLTPALYLSEWLGFRDGWQWGAPDWWQGSIADIIWTALLLVIVVGLLGFLHLKVRQFAAGRVIRLIAKRFAPGAERERMSSAFLHSTRPWRSIFSKSPAGWGRRSQKRLQAVIAEANQYVQVLNDAFTDPSGEQRPPTQQPVADKTPSGSSTAETTIEQPGQ